MGHLFVRGSLVLGFALVGLACAAPTTSVATNHAAEETGPVSYAYTGVSDQGTDKPCLLTIQTSDGHTVTGISMQTYVLDHSFEIGDHTTYQTGAVMPKDVPPSSTGGSDGSGPVLEGGDIHQTPFILSTTAPFFQSGVTLTTSVSGYNPGSLIERLLTVTQSEKLEIPGSVDNVTSFKYSATIKLFPLGLIHVDSAEASCHDMTPVPAAE
jgi:hypothetical protein